MANNRKEKSRRTQNDFPSTDAEYSIHSSQIVAELTRSLASSLARMTSPLSSRHQNEASNRKPQINCSFKLDSGGRRGSTCNNLVTSFTNRCPQPRLVSRRFKSSVRVTKGCRLISFLQEHPSSVRRLHFRLHNQCSPPTSPPWLLNQLRHPLFPMPEDTEPNGSLWDFEI